MKYVKAIFLVLFYSLITLSLFARFIDDEDAFFSYDRFYLKAALLNEVSGDKDIRSDVKAFMRSFSDGIYAISASDPEKAKTKLLRARTIWPEYFGTDFLLARVSEDTGDYGLSARFYKSYLNKLRDFSEGKYRISEPLMRKITPYRVEDYDDAYELVKHRLKDHGIDLDTVRPFYAIPGFLRSLIVLLVLGSGYAAVSYGIIPYVKRRRDVNNPPEGYWACKKCETYNSNIRTECEKCGEKKE